MNLEVAMSNSKGAPSGLCEQFLASKAFRPTLLLVLLGVSLFFLWFSAAVFHVWQDPPKNQVEEFSKHIFPHLFAVTYELLLGVVIIEWLWRSHEKRREMTERREQLRLIKSYMFQAHMQKLFEANFRALTSTCKYRGEAVTMKRLVHLVCPRSKDEQKEFQESLEYGCDKKMDAVILEYVNAEKNVWLRFLEMAIQFNFKEIVRDMTEILRLVDEVKKVRTSHSTISPGELSVLLKKNENQNLMPELEKVLKAGILRWWEYADELSREDDQSLFEALKASYKL
jgi:hypothetical protein